MPTTLEDLTQWLMTKGLHIVVVVLFAVITTRLIRWTAGRISRRLTKGDQRDATTQSETVKHGQAVASVISSVAISVLYVVVAVDVANQLGLPLGSLVAPAAVLGAALGFGAQRIVQDLLSGFFIITEKQYGFGDLVALTVTGGGDAQGTVEDVTLRVTKLRTSDGEVFTVPRAVTPAAVARVKDLRRPTEKMGKSGSDGSGVVFLLDDPDTVAAKVRRAVTDSDPELGHDPEARPGVANLAVLLGAFQGRPPERALDGLRGAAALKDAVAEVLVEALRPIQKAYADLVADRPTLLAVLEAGAATAGPIAGGTVARARQAIGLLG